MKPKGFDLELERVIHGARYELGPGACQLGVDQTTEGHKIKIRLPTLLKLWKDAIQGGC